MKKHVLSIIVENHPGVLSKVSGLFSRRGYNIESLNVSITEDPTTSRITITANGDDATIEQIIKQLNKLIDVIKVQVIDLSKAVSREIALIKVSTTLQNRSSIIEVANIFRSNIIDINEKSMIVEATGDSSKISALIEMLRPFGIIELIRTGLTALQRGSEAAISKSF
ncbi:acetolactate synthase small subunit [Clostridium sp. 19966]|uniref:acetolactate synthase small subunit n=1 Tax=Clostridium sp. 19966 TaxID=2768166 RepID=UPI0028DFA494|nr:acetolactate synthase small subunit [Clostridium sp. 19966]MDT8718718.1 acetolactate synthase small subunit [Clostridium sp. 19966]